MITDFIDFSKDSKTLVISKSNLINFCQILLNVLKSIFNFIFDFKGSNFADWERYEMSLKSEIIYQFRNGKLFQGVRQFFVDKIYPVAKQAGQNTTLPLVRRVQRTREIKD
jgi:hypothetical protein